VHQISELCQSRRTSTKSDLKTKNMPLVGGLCHITDFDQYGLKNMPLVGGLYHVTDFDQLKGPKVRPSSEDFVTSRTSTKYGPKMCPSSEDFITSRTLTKYGPKTCPSLEDFATSRAFDQVLSDMCHGSGRNKKFSFGRRQTSGIRGMKGIYHVLKANIIGISSPIQ